jgi:hypothetical protein
MNVVKWLIDVLKRMWDRFSSGLERIFGKSVKSMSDLANIMIFKIAAIIEFLKIMLEPVFDFIVDALLTIIEWVKGFAEGFSEAFGSIMEPMEDIFGSFKRLFDLFDLGEGKGNALIATFKTLGAVLGTVVRSAIMAVAQALDTLVSALESAKYQVRIAKAVFRGDMKEAVKLTYEQQMVAKKHTERFSERQEKMQSRLGKTGEYIKGAWSEPELPKTVPMSTKSSVNNNQNNVINVNVKSEKTPEETGKKVGQAIRIELMNQKVLSGR